MTMTRNEKATHAVQMRNAREHEFTSVRFSSPKLSQTAKADRGHDYMNTAEYLEHRMSRRTVSVDMVWDRLMTRRGFRGTEAGGWVKVTRAL